MNLEPEVRETNAQHAFLNSIVIQIKREYHLIKWRIKRALNRSSYYKGHDTKHLIVRAVSPVALKIQFHISGEMKSFL